MALQAENVGRSKFRSKSCFVKHAIYSRRVITYSYFKGYNAENLNLNSSWGAKHISWQVKESNSLNSFDTILKDNLLNIRSEYRILLFELYSLGKAETFYVL